MFDSWAVIAFFQDEAAAPEVESLIVRAAGAEGLLWITAVNLGEVWYRVARERSPAQAEEAVRIVRRLGFSVEPIDWNLARVAAELKARHRIAYADCFAAALARQKNLPLVTGDPEFRQLEKEIHIQWL